MKTKVSKAGRISLYKTVNKDHLRKLILHGFTDEQIADFYGICRETLRRWKRKYPDFRKEMSTWKEQADKNVEISTYDAACGYSCPETKVFNINGKLKKITITKYYPPDVTAAIFWLTNRQHGDWKRTRQEVGADPLSVKVYNIIKNNKNGKKKNKDDELNVETAIQSTRKNNGRMKIV